MSAYFLFDVREIRDPNKTKDYQDQVFATVAEYDGRYLSLGKPVDVLEGDWRPGIAVIIEFPNLERARQWYESELYRPIRQLRLDATDSCGVLLDGFNASAKG